MGLARAMQRRRRMKFEDLFERRQAGQLSQKTVVAIRPVAALPAPQGPHRNPKHPRRILLAQLTGLPPFEEESTAKCGAVAEFGL